MGTSYTELYKKFLNKISDFDLPMMDDEELLYYCYEIMCSALVRTRKILNDLSDRSDDCEGSFTVDLIEYEKEIIARQMVIEWVERKLNNSQLLNMYVGTKDESMNSQANHIKQLESLVVSERAAVAALIRDYKYQEWVGEAD